MSERGKSMLEGWGRWIRSNNGYWPHKVSMTGKIAEGLISGGKSNPGFRGGFKEVAPPDEVARVHKALTPFFDEPVDLVHDFVWKRFVEERSVNEISRLTGKSRRAVLAGIGRVAECLAKI